MLRVILVFSTFLFLNNSIIAQNDTLQKVPFADRETDWIVGQNRQKTFPLIYKNKDTDETILSGGMYLDTYFNYNFAKPIDNTHNNSATMGRSNEFTINLASFGVETNYKNVLGKVYLQYGSSLNIINELDPTLYRGQYSLPTNLKFIREASAGYHFKKWYGVNLEMGIMLSYIGLESYLTQENWCYQRSMCSDFTPFYFQGARLQIFPTKNYRTELWLVNGWQSYNSFSNSPGIGFSNLLRPTNNLQLTANLYYGKDTYNPDTLGMQSNKMRFHHDHSAVIRYLNHPKSNGISQMAFSINNHLGFQKNNDPNDLITIKQNYFVGIAISNRIWFQKNKYALTLRADGISNAGAYLISIPSPVTPNDFTNILLNEPNKEIRLYQATVTFDIMPNDHVTFRLEYGYRKSNIPYFAGHNGTTSPSGWINGPTTKTTWRPDLKTEDNRVSLSINLRL